LNATSVPFDQSIALIKRQTYAGNSSIHLILSILGLFSRADLE